MHTILIGGFQTHTSDWLSFAVWYSIMKYCPDAKVVISLPKQPLEQLSFRWLDRCKVRRYKRENHISPEEHYQSLIENKTITQPCLFVSDHTLMTDPLEKENCFLTFTDKIGNFDISLWKNKNAPFGASWETKDNTEKCIQQAWKNMVNYYNMVVR